MTLDELEQQLRAGLEELPDEEPFYYPDWPRFDLMSDSAEPRPIALDQFEDGEASRDRRLPGRPSAQDNRRRYLGVREALVAAAVLCLAAMGVTLALVPGNARKASASDVLLEAAHNVDASATTVPGPGQDLHLETTSMDQFYEGAHGQHWRVSLPVTADVWVGTDGSGVLKTVEGAPVFPSAADRTAWIAAGSPVGPFGHDQIELMGAGVTFVSPGMFGRNPQDIAGNYTQHLAIERIEGLPQPLLPYSDISQLPTDPTALERFLVDRYEDGTAVSRVTFSLAASLLREGTSSSQRTALFTMLSTLPGVTLDGTVTTNVTGQTGTSLSVSDEYGSSTIVVDPSSGELLEQRYTASHGTLPIGGAQATTTAPPVAGPIPTPGVTATPLNGYTVYRSSQVVGSDAVPEPASAHP